MKLADAHANEVGHELDARAIPADHPVIPELNRLYGDHTFFLDGTGLIVLEATEPRSERAASAKVFRLAKWENQACTSLKSHAPQPTDVVVDLPTRVAK